MTKPEYIAKQQTITRGLNKRLIWWFVVFLGAVGAMIPLSNYMERHEEFTWVGNVVGIGLLFLLLGSIVCLLLFTKRWQREYGIQCRNCGKQILNSQLAIATGNCGYCGEKLFD
jgi:hypothetical protein